MKLTGEIRSSGVAVTLVVHEHKRLGRGIELAMLAEELKASDVILEFLTGELKGSHEPSASCLPCSPRCPAWSASTSATVPSKATSPPASEARPSARASPTSPWSPFRHLRDQEMSLRDIAKRLVITTGAKKGQHPSPATVMRMRGAYRVPVPDSLLCREAPQHTAGTGRAVVGHVPQVRQVGAFRRWSGGHGPAALIAAAGAAGRSGQALQTPLPCHLEADGSYLVVDAARPTGHSTTSPAPTTPTTAPCSSPAQLNSHAADMA